MADFGVADRSGDEAAVEEHPAGRVIGLTGYITTGTGFEPGDDPGNPTPGIRLMTPEEKEVWEGKVIGKTAETPRVRRCEVVKENGYRCRRVPAEGETYCHCHRRYRLSGMNTHIDVPLLEDPASIRLTLTQAVRAMARGDLPPANARAIIAGCRQAQSLLDYELRKARLEEKTAERLERAAARGPQEAGMVAAAAPAVGERVLAGAPALGPVPPRGGAGSDDGDVESDEERAQAVLAAVEAREAPGEPEDVAPPAEEVRKRWCADSDFRKEALREQWERGIAGLDLKAWRLHKRLSAEKRAAEGRVGSGRGRG